MEAHNNHEDHQVSQGDEETDSCNNEETKETLDLCDLIKQAPGYQSQARLIHSGGSLRVEGDDILPMKRFLTRVPSTPLGALIDDGQLTDKHKAVLSYLLADSVWQYYNSGWDEWSNESIQFMSEREEINSKSEIVYLNQPFLRSKFDQSVREKDEAVIPEKKEATKKGGMKKSWTTSKSCYVAQKRSSHDYPKILALGIMLLEIQLGRKLISFKTADYYDENPMIAQHLVAMDVIGKSNEWPPKRGSLALKDITEICIDNQKSKKVFGKDGLMVRQRLFEQIVAPIRVFVLEGWKHKGIDLVDPVRLDSIKDTQQKAAGKDTKGSDAEPTEGVSMKPHGKDTLSSVRFAYPRVYVIIIC